MTIARKKVKVKRIWFSIRDKTTRHLYYLQLRKDVLEGNIYVHEETAMLMASYALQAEISDQSPGGPSSLYFAPEKYLPHRVSKKRRINMRRITRRK